MSTVPNTTDQPSSSERSSEHSLNGHGGDNSRLALVEVADAALEARQLADKPLNVTSVETNYRWNRRYSRPERFVDIWSFFLSFLGKRWLYNKSWSYAGGISPEKQAARRRAQARWIRLTFLNLGPTFIKLGQLFSTRSDLFPTEYVEELSKLQDQVPAFSYEQVKAIIEDDLGRPIGELYRTFDPIPLAAASLGQVHRAQLHSGEEIVVKVQRPGLQRLFQIDLSILKGIAHYFQSHPEWGRGRDWIGIYEECCRILWLEIDFLHEGRNADTFRRNFRAIDWVKAPRIYWRYASRRVLTLEYLPGIKISHYESLEAAGLDRQQLAQLGAQAYLHQLLNDGFFHADPHPGNIAVNPDGALIFYDFGMMGQIQPLTRDGLMRTFMGVSQRNADMVMASLIDLGALTETEDMGPVRRSIQYILDNFMDKPFEEQSITAISDDLYAVAYDQPFRFPATFTFVMRAFSTLEGVGKGLDPDFNFMEAAKPFANQLMTNVSNSSTNGLIGEIGRQAAQVGSSAFGLPRRIEDSLDRLDRGDIRVRVRSIETDRAIRRLSSVNLMTNYTLLLGTFTLSATLLLISQLPWVALGMILPAIASGIALVRALMRLGRTDRMP
ncbi:AarF/ABC1/UbiB kinase family protein [Leptolyngbyaceae cyanobacterium CCMR0082]|uniref:AarF/ABC1/UbiB kinase family protein n=2 Tax=Adonisia turfae TaxID=2950184 RepID=A0A6M0S2X4_9CYAN|nr:AarF/ABC1/UbiB kinase family protein [Leptothoe sp. LEGE 181152]NEZ58302.1 AarF/ABC1/UbiB kinase family protein [Adonisia turfae CCMR0081]NEZ62807.1 AarF/ABC1/UbiB kinase family protein [Adonisia turfae CCMR0082]